MRVLILGGGGMLGHRLSRVWRDEFDVWVTYRNSKARYADYRLADDTRQLDGVNAEQPVSVAKAIKQVSPDVVLNCIGLVKQRDHGQRRTLSAVNALFPHLLASYCMENNCRLIHISTDCVYSGRKGMYTEQDVPDPVDEYGMSKLLGEPLLPNVLTLRTSLIGWELDHHTSLLEWFVSQRGKTIKGYRKAIFSGYTTQSIAGMLSQIITRKPDLSGLYHLASDPISKFDLLSACIEALNWHDIQLQGDDSLSIDRSLDASTLNEIMKWKIPDWQTMIYELSQDWLWYKQFRQD